MSTPEFPRTHAHHAPANADAPAEPPRKRDPLGFLATLDRIGKGAAADGQPWPERHPMPGRRMALGDADCAVAGQRVTLELLLAAERVRQNGADSEYVGDRVLEGLAMASLALNAQIGTRMRPDE
ncbi:MAG: hypothetical protein LBV10_05340 [Stenotrophomonas sp.]|jgi:hypothetical protein|uniref:hypothetical protein n=1 Tax=Stenotrophomonas sp. TaxID=69392 RepID=UPI002848951B|nr:hypothetical protein [Stenotrophomonas sp.]MDR2958950.1 hypothetical protein [Stenotrophomonas sp.]